MTSIHDFPDELLLPILSGRNSRELNSLSKLRAILEALKKRNHTVMCTEDHEEGFRR
jgi:hypothetical protein